MHVFLRASISVVHVFVRVSVCVHMYVRVCLRIAGMFTRTHVWQRLDAEGKNAETPPANQIGSQGQTQHILWLTVLPLSHCEQKKEPFLPSYCDITAKPFPMGLIT